jgi:hypothetical protein
MIELLQLSQVLDTVRQTGTEVRYHHAKCSTTEAAGWYRLSANVDRLVICPDNQLNHSDLFDTVRHEAIHVVQACNAGPILPYDYYIKNAPQHIKDRVFSNYPKQHHHIELEAFMSAEYLNEDDVVKMLNKFCFN